MQQIGEVVELKGKLALVRIKRASSCGENCSSCSGECKSTASLVTAVNGLCAKVGDTVKLEMNSALFLFLAFIGYILPIIICIATYLITLKLTDSTVLSDILAVCSIIVTLVVFYIVDKLPQRSTRFTSKIIKILR